MPEKVTIAYRGAKYEIGRGKRYYGIWVAGAPESDPIDRWPENRDGWNQAWARFTAVETPGTINVVDKPRAGFRLPVRKRTPSEARPGRPARAAVAAGLIGAGVLLGLIGLFPGYVVFPLVTGSQSVASLAEDLVPHLIYLAAWAASGAGVALGARRAVPRFETLRLGALLGCGLSAVTFGLFFSDLGQVISGGSSLLGAGLVLSLIGWLACAAGSLLALSARPRAAASVTQPGWQPVSQAEAPPAEPSPAEGSPAMSSPAGPPPAGPSFVWPSPATPAAASFQPGAQAWPASAAAPFAAAPSGRAPAGRAPAGGPAGPRMADAGRLALVLLAAIGAVAAFAPAWDRFVLTQPATGATETVTQGNAFAEPGVMIAGSVAVMVAVIAVAVLAALWRPVRHGAVLLAGATIPLAAQAISALIQVREPTSPAIFGIPASAGVTITSGVTPIFWVYCVFVISLVVSCAWMLTAPRYPAAMRAASQSPAPGPVHVHPAQGVDYEDGDSDGGDAEDGAQSTYA